MALNLKSPGLYKSIKATNDTSKKYILDALTDSETAPPNVSAASEISEYRNELKLG